MLFSRAPEALPLYLALRGRLLARFPAAEVRARKTQIGFFERCGFAYVSLPRRRGDRGLLVSFGLPARLASPRVLQAVQPYPGRWTHHVLVPDEAALDAELLDWLGQSRAFSLVK